ncbi:hypothetical protein [Polymorphospora sp. NPDC050346]|uniref:hypothetical protein n=1 Tax=Polymorphospora sp. NPDC050346 TaxID=3155780 RepID=UPI0033F1DF90
MSAHARHLAATAAGYRRQIASARHRLNQLISQAETRLDDEDTDRQYVIEDLLTALAELTNDLNPNP